MTYTPPDLLNLYTWIAIATASLALTGYLTTRFYPRIRQNKRVREHTRTTTLVLALATCIAATISLVYIEPVAHLREWAHTHQIELTDQQAVNLLKGKPITRDSITHQLIPENDSTYTLTLTPAE